MTTTMPTYGWLYPPRAWLRLRERVKRLFTPTPFVVFHLTPARRRVMVDVQNSVNEAVQYRRDGDQDIWEIAKKYGDCEDIALRKREELAGQAWPRGCLLLAACVTETGEGHAVLTVETDKGTWVLDNRWQGIRGWDELPYKWLGREPAPGRFWWQRIGKPND